MSLTVLDILVKNFLFGEKTIGSMVLNGSSGTTLKKFNIDDKYQDKLIRKSLLIENNNYDSFGFSNYILSVKNGLSKDLRKKVLIRERILDIQTRKSLMKLYSM